MAKIIVKTSVWIENPISIEIDGNKAIFKHVLDVEDCLLERDKKEIYWIINDLAYDEIYTDTEREFERQDSEEMEWEDLT